MKAVRVLAKANSASATAKDLLQAAKIWTRRNKPERAISYLERIIVI